jgi:hypothetical protein
MGTLVLLATALAPAACRSAGRPASGDDPSWVIVVSADRSPLFQVSALGGERVTVCGPLSAAVDALNGWRTESILPASDGRRIACQGAGLVYVAETDDPQRIRQLEGLSDVRGWSADGEQLVGEVFRGPTTWGLGVADTRTGEVRCYWDVVADDYRDAKRAAFSPEGDRVAFTKNHGGIAVLDLATGAVTVPDLPGAARDDELLDWLADGRMVWFARKGSAVRLARPGDAAAASIPLGEREFPLCCRPDGRAVFCRSVQTAWLAACAYPGAVIRDADGRSFELWDDGPLAEGAVWMRAPGLLPAAPDR